MNPVEIHRGDGPVVLGLPHTGTYIPDDIAAKLNDRGRLMADTDWHVHTLYDGLSSDITTVRATFHRYVIDANRDPAGANPYPGQNVTTLAPLTDFDGAGIWDAEPTEDDIAHRLSTFHAVYHRALAAELDRARARHGVVVLYDCHSIRSEIPFLFEGVLPDFNIGTNDGETCDPAIKEATREICEAANGYGVVVDGRFKGGWTTRHYGRPEVNRHAIQMELAQSTYLRAEEPPWSYDTARAEKLRVHLSEILKTLTNLAPLLRGDS